MPHLIIEYPQDVIPAEQVEALLDALHASAVATGLFEPGHIRVRAIPLQYYRVGGRREPFIHVQCRIHTGRSVEQKQGLSGAVLAAIKGQGVSLQSITVEVVEMERASYAKHSG